MSTDYQKRFEEKMLKSISFLKEDLNTVRAGKANASILDKISVEYYGTPTPLKGLANISVPDPRTLMISPFDPTTIALIEKALGAANLGINPSNDGKIIRLVVPQLTEERRKELTKSIKKFGEDSKVAVRNERREANDHLKKQEKDGELTEDDLKSELDAVQKKTDKCMKEIDEIIMNKEKELMEV